MLIKSETMRVASSNAVFVVYLLLVLLLPPPPPFVSVKHATAQQETDDEGEFSYRRGEDNGPELWGTLRREWAACSWGRRQSPIPLISSAAGHRAPPTTAGRMLRSYRAASATLVNRGHDIMVRFDGDAGGVVVDGAPYRLRQMHWHSPSEHAVDGRRYDLELHMLHESNDGRRRYAVVSQFYEIGGGGGQRDGTLHELEPYIERIAKWESSRGSGSRRRRRKRTTSEAGRHEEVEVDGVVDPARPVVGSTVYYRYTGSFTTPPCTEGVTWMVSRNVRHVARHQVELLREAVHDGARSNARPLQEADGRVVRLYYGDEAAPVGGTTLFYP